jgi:hypothetical protein
MFKDEIKKTYLKNDNKNKPTKTLTLIMKLK